MPLSKAPIKFHFKISGRIAPLTLMNLFNNLPYPLKAGLILLGGIAFMGVFYFLARGTGGALWVIAGGIILIAAVLGIYWFVLRWVRKRKAQKMSATLGQHNTLAPTGLSNPAARARLDDLRQNFSAGIQKFKAAGKDIYSLPWYCLIGEPGSGKTEAVRHSNIGFPPGLQDECQGVGGTINMNWWFTNQAVILDTAGRLLFEDVVAGSTNEWREFLRLLNKTRPNQPINGMLLTIPSDSLIRDTAEEIERKAHKIAVQLDEIQRILDVRFPVFVIITKCDLIHGFREFFENITDPDLQHQMVGWSNPETLDTPFRPELVDQNLEGLIERLERYRTGLIQDPTPRDTAKKRIDETDSLFAFPTNLKLLFPRLRRYMEMIFVAGEWSQKPLFLRGIYFTSSMQEGSAMDQDLAEALGLSLEELPEERAWEREKAYFLRDTYTQKVFKERYLVTRASNTKKWVRRQQIALFGIGFVGLFTLLGFAWYGARALKASIGEQREYWSKAADERNWSNGLWSPRIVTSRGDGSYSNNAKALVALEEEDIELVDYHNKLKELSRKSIKVPTVFKPFSALTRVVAGGNLNRKAAQRIVFEAGALKPFVFSTWDKMSAQDEPWTLKAKQALLTLIRLEGAIIQKKLGEEPEVDAVTPFAGPLMDYLTRKEIDITLDEILEWTYSRRGAGTEYWPPLWLSAGSTLKENEPIKAGLNQFLSFARESLKANAAKLSYIKSLREQLKMLQGKEEKLYITVKVNAEDKALWQNVRPVYEAYQKAKEALDSSLLAARGEGIGETDEWLLLAPAYNQQIQKAQEDIDQTLNELNRLVELKSDEFEFDDSFSEDETLDVLSATREKLIEDARQRLETKLEDNELTLFLDISDKLTKERQRLKQSIQSILSEEAVKELKRFDKSFLAEYKKEKEAIYEARWNLYKECLDQLTAENKASPADLIGNFTQAFTEVESTLERLKRRVDVYTGSYEKEFHQTCDIILSQAKVSRIRQLIQHYIEAVDSEIIARVEFPLVLPYQGKTLGEQQVQQLDEASLKVLKDLREDILDKLSTDEANPLKSLLEKISSLQAVSKALFSQENALARCKLKLPRYQDQQKLISELLGQSSVPSPIPLASDQWRGGIQINDSGKKRPENVVESLAEISVNEKVFNLQLYLFPDDVTPAHEIDLSGQWAPLRFITDQQSLAKEGGKIWDVVLPISLEGGRDYYLLVTVEFDSALPAPKLNWPKRETLRLE